MKKILFFGIHLLTFILLAVFGISSEAKAYGWVNGIPALLLIIPPVALCLSMINYAFIKKYDKNKAAVKTAFILPLALCLAGDGFALIHYGFPPGWKTIICPCIIIGLYSGLTSYLSTLFYIKYINVKR